jgi:hypothetical protein
MTTALRECGFSPEPKGLSVMTTNLVQPTQLELQVGSRNLAQAAAAMEKMLPKSGPAPMLAETMNQAERREEFKRMANAVGPNLAQFAMRLRIPQ